MSGSIGISDKLSNCDGVLLYFCDINHVEKSIEKNFLLIRICGLMDSNVDLKIDHFRHGKFLNLNCLLKLLEKTAQLSKKHLADRRAPSTVIHLTNNRTYN